MIEQEFDTPGDALAHFGVKGMRWGVRKEQGPKPELSALVKAGSYSRKTANGDLLTLTVKPPSSVSKKFANVNKRYDTFYRNTSHFSISDKTGKKIGHARFDRDGDAFKLQWISIEKSARGQGYATEVLKASVEHGKKLGIKRMVLEVPGNAPDAQHIYEKMGFKLTGKGERDPKESVWGGLLEMEYKFE